ncbi:hypothetical protein AVEN_274148-1 [Araneus ventricosus]|uniref:Uncharacterized protein n=1 Tax=Araneus ventricosus TaxID=182803 RepID=A0A4Y2FZY2_ARAVE|nr:hypothetical protein AVEN_274148-1 [Araneus ventricosus]
MVPTVDLERENSLKTSDWHSPFSVVLIIFTLSSMEKAFRLLTPPILKLCDIKSSNHIQQMELKKVKECVVTCTSSLSSFVRHKGNRCAFPLEYKERRLRDKRSFVVPPLVTLGDGLKMTITGGVAINTVFP